jgi:hypothetical protein
VFTSRKVFTSLYIHLTHLTNLTHLIHLTHQILTQALVDDYKLWVVLLQQALCLDMSLTFLLVFLALPILLV